MADLIEEIDDNYARFVAAWPKAIYANVESQKEKNALKLSYRRIAALNALKVDFIQDVYPDGSANFFYEAHNDALTSHVNASFCAWRPALQALRSVLENTLAFLYYRDHPVEFELWKRQKHRIASSELRTYIEGHPVVADSALKFDLVEVIKSEYRTLSFAVHASHPEFRMTDAKGSIQLWKPDDASLGKWSSREKRVIEVCTLLVVLLDQEHFVGAQRSSLRKVLGQVMSKSLQDDLLARCSVRIGK